jgi:hypothetical protein
MEKEIAVDGTLATEDSKVRLYIYNSLLLFSLLFHSFPLSMLFEHSSIATLRGG